MTVTYGLNDSGDLVVRLDPHDGTCHGAHDIVVLVMANIVGAGVHITYAWEATALLSHVGTREFHDAMGMALEVGETLAMASSMAEATRMADDLAKMLKDTGAREV